MKRLFVTLSFAWALAAGCNCGDDQTGRLASELAVEPTSLDFGEVPVGTSATKTFKVSNRGTAPLHVQLASTEAVYTVEPTQAEIPLDASATFTVTFAPVEAGEDPVEGSIEIDSDGGAATVGLSGRGIAGAVAITPAQIDFGDVARDRPDTTRDDRKKEVAGVFRIFNGGSSEIEVVSVELVDDGGGVFSGDFSDVLGTIAPARERTGRVIFDPPDLATYEGALRITTTASELPTFDIALRGRGTAPIVVVCTSMLDDPESETCTPELPPAGGVLPELRFGDFEDLGGRVGKVRFLNQGNVPLELSSMHFLRESSDIRFYTDEALEERLNLGRLGKVICPADVVPGEDNGCAHQGELALWVAYRARGFVCCDAGVEECTDLVPEGGTCSDVPNTDRAELAFNTNDLLYQNLIVSTSGQSRIPQANVPPEAAAELSLAGGNKNFPVILENEGPVPLMLYGVRFSDPDDTSCGEPPCFCDEAETPTRLCDFLYIAGHISFPIEILPGGRQTIVVFFDETTPGIYKADMWWETNDPSELLGRTRLTITIRQ